MNQKSIVELDAIVIKHSFHLPDPTYRLMTVEGAYLAILIRWGTMSLRPLWWTGPAANPFSLIAVGCRRRELTLRRDNKDK